MNKFIFSILALILVSNISNAQRAAEEKEFHFLVLFEDKGLRYVHLYDSANFLSEAAINRRKRYDIAIDSLDLPVTKAYLKNIREAGVKVRYATRWLNGAVVTVRNPDDARRLRVKFFVKQVVFLGSTKIRYVDLRDNKPLASEEPIGFSSVNFSKADYGQSYQQIAMLNGHKLHEQGYRGRDIHIAVFDAGFKKHTTLKAFKHLYYDKRLVSIHDIVDLDEQVDDADAHGMHVLGCISGYMPGTYIGTAPEAKVSLFRTEASHYELLIEELNWIRAAEIADSLGVDIINSSLGYTTFDDPFMDHTQEDLDGVTTYVAKGAKIAASRGMLIVNSAGNDGNKPWKKLDTPADVMEILTVGAVDSDRERVNFSSTGPTSDGRIKPDICALGHQTALVSTYGGAYSGNGTSYSTPVMTGFMACLMQKYPDIPPSVLCDAIRFGASKQGRPDTLVGYGIPDAKYSQLALGENSSEQFNLLRPLKFDKKEFSIDYSGSDTLDLYIHVYEKRAFLFFPYKKLLENGKFKKMGNLHRYYWDQPDGKKNALGLRISTSSSFKGSKKQALVQQELKRL